MKGVGPNLQVISEESQVQCYKLSTHYIIDGFLKKEYG